MTAPPRDLAEVTVGLVGLGYVGLPLAVEFGKKFATVGFDISQTRVDQLNQGEDLTLEVSAAELKEATKLSFSCEPEALKACNVFIVTVPTPIDQYKRPNLGPLESASETIGGVITPGSVVIYESTVYPGATEEVCIPVVERVSGLKYNQDFYAGYSPERINPGDKAHSVTSIVKVTSGSTPAVADFVDALYCSVITAGTFRAKSIRVAEAAKVIENTQRDLNIALINELALIFERLGIDTHDVLAAAETKWNFLPFKPGLVGGHCIGVDPYYLTFKAQEIGYHPDVILAGRRINDEMGQHVAEHLVRLMTKQGINVVESKILILGLAFKENCPDLRNTKVVDVISALDGYNVSFDVCDPWVSATEAKHEYDVDLVDNLQEGSYDAVVLAVAHDQFVNGEAMDLTTLCKDNHVIYDLKNVLPREIVTARL